jgi:hypothetical protein
LTTVARRAPAPGLTVPGAGPVADGPTVIVRCVVTLAPEAMTAVADAV